MGAPTFRFKRGTAWCGARTLVGGYMPAVDVCRARVVAGEKLCPRHLKARNPARYAEIRALALGAPKPTTVHTMYDRDGNPIKVTVPE